MAYTPNPTWNNGAGPGISASALSNIETQYTEASQSFGPDLFTAFVLTGLTVSADGVNLSQVDMTSGTAYVKQSSDNTLRRRAVSSQNFTASTPSATYYLDLNSDGTMSWATTHSTDANHLTIATVTTDASTHIATVTDTRTLGSTLLPSMSAALSFGQSLTLSGVASSAGVVITGRQGFGSSNPAITFASGSHVTEYWTPQTGGSSQGHAYITWNGSVSKVPFSVGGQFESATSWVDNSGHFYDNGLNVPYINPTGGTTAGRQIFTGTTTPTGANEGDIWLKF